MLFTIVTAAVICYYYLIAVIACFVILFGVLAAVAACTTWHVEVWRGSLALLLGVHSKSVPNHALISELCIFPLQRYWLCSCARFWCKINDVNSNILSVVAKSGVALGQVCKRCWVAELNAGLQDINAHISTNAVDSVSVPGIVKRDGSDSVSRVFFNFFV